MIVCGIDVGILNLAFCIIDSEKWKSDKSGIIDWKCLNIIENQFCSGKLGSGKRKGEICGKVASFKNDGEYYCKVHSPPKSKKYTQKTSKNQTTEQLLLCLFEKLENYEDLFSQAETIVIEQQPKVNPKMKSMSIGLQSYFLYKYKLNGNLKTCRFSSAKNKMKVYQGPKINSTKKTKYLKLKETAELQVIEILKETDYTEKYFIGKKRDDLADAFLHCLFAIK